MHIGLVMFPTDEAIRPDELARAAEERGFESLIFPEHTHIPVSRESPFPAGGELPRYYARTYDPFVALTAAAMATERLLVGTGVCLVAQRDPIVTAKAIASLDRLSGGRFLFGVGYGWNREEAADHGVEFTRRRDVLREKILAMQRLWTEEEASFYGEFVRFPPTWCWPKPIQQPRPSIILGGAAGSRTFAHVAEFADAWMPIRGRGLPLEEAIPQLRDTLVEHERDPDEVWVAVFGAKEDKAELDRYRGLGVRRAFLTVPPLVRDELLPVLDRYARTLE